LNKKLLTISIVIYKIKLTELKRFLNYCEKIKFSHKVFIIDNNIKSNLSKKIKLKDNYQYLRQKNVGFGKGHNSILKKINSEFHLVCNTDIIFNPHKLGKIIKFVKDKKTIGVIGPKIIDKKFKNFGNQKLLPSPLEIFLRKFFKNYYIYKNSSFNKNFFKIKKPIEVLNISGCFMLFRTKIFKKINGFDSRYFLYFEDVDICRKILKIKKKVFYFPDFKIIHTARSSQRTSLIISFISGISAIKYFLKWGIFDKEREFLNKHFIKKIN